MTVSLRPMTLDDVPWAAALEAQIFPDAWTPTLIEEEVGHQARRYVVAESDGRPVGYAGVWIQPDDAEVMTIGVAPEERGQGIGSALLTWIIDMAKSNGASALFLEVRADNEAAQKMYAVNGFENVGVRKKYYSPDGCDAIVMRLDLSSTNRSTLQQ